MEKFNSYTTSHIVPCVKENAPGMDGDDRQLLYHELDRLVEYFIENDPPEDDIRPCVIETLNECVDMNDPDVMNALTDKLEDAFMDILYEEKMWRLEARLWHGPNPWGI